MLPEPVSLPFSIKKVHNGFSRMEGIAKASETGLSLEYEIKVLGLLRLPVKEFTVPLSQIESIALKKNWFTTRVVIRTRSLRALNGFPSSQPAQVILSVSRSGRKTAERTVSLLTLYLSDHLLKCVLNGGETFGGPHNPTLSDCTRNAQNTILHE